MALKWWVLAVLIVAFALLGLLASMQQGAYRTDVERAKMAIEQQAGDMLTATVRARGN